eukprot:TRINITY_DN3168_c0_g1_i1.p1 TRINITY_DN3168_c0_g1~~TRINITY_DN3168_c0_g1_i1.p1  ORF type:complete len:587 (-),score=238.60 TRINITY_DN3168_c0_g1_i1:115-1854(-)
MKIQALVFIVFLGVCYCTLYPSYQFNDSWNVIGKASENIVIPVRIALRQRNLEEFRQKAADIRNPLSLEYTNYMSIDEIMNIIAPPVEDQMKVIQWLNNYGITEVTNKRDFVEFEAPIVVLNKLFHTEIKMVQHEEESAIQHKIVEGYEIPEFLEDVIEFVQDLPFFIHKRNLAKFADDSPSKDVLYPQTIEDLYSIGNYVISTNSSVNVWEFTNLSYKVSDFEEFIKGTDLQVVPQNITQIGANNNVIADAECTLDIQYITSIGSNATNFYLTSTSWVLEAAQTVFNYQVPILVNSISWSADEKSEGYDYNSRADTEFQKLGTRGITVLAASGDSGADCNGFQNGFSTGYPATSPYVVSVGATEIVSVNPSPKDNLEEAALPPVCSDYRYTCTTCSNGCSEEPADPAGSYASGGGVSYYEARPSYQDTVVSAYLNTPGITLPPSSYYNASNRFFPDVAANGDNILIYLNGDWTPIGGTSAATPIWGGIIAVLNDFLISQNKQPLGTVNDFLYKMNADEADTIISIGTSSTNNKDGCQYGWDSNPNGYDPVTGLGTPNVNKMLSYVQNNLALFKDYNIR